MKSAFSAGPLALGFAALTLLSACGSNTPAPAAAPAPAPVAAPAPAPIPNPMADASNACEAAVAASFLKARGHANHQLTFLDADRKATATRAKDVISAAGAGTYDKAGKPVKVTYTCTFNANTNKVTASRWK